MANWLSGARLAAAPLMLLLAARGLDRVCAAVLVAAGVTDALDGLIARLTGGATAFGARLDGAADAALLGATGTSLLLLHHEIWQAAGWLLVSASLVVAAWAAAQRAYGQIVAPGQASSKVAGAMLYGFALFTLWTDRYEPLLLEAAAAVLAIASLETVVRAMRRRWNDVTVIHASGSPNRHLSHRPHASNDIATSTGAGASSASSPAAMARENRRP